jgi:uncharacterized protein YndB with AHSA1/START domain
MIKTVDGAVVRKSARVQAPIERAFSVFVEQMETWWPAEHHIAAQPFQSIFVEPRAGGRWYERDADGNECEWGRVLVWEPPHRVTLSWHLGPDWEFNPDPAKASEVEIRFTAEAPSTTVVELEHSAIERHGEGYEQLRDLLDGPDAWTLTLARFAAKFAAEFDDSADGEVQA